MVMPSRKINVPTADGLTLNIVCHGDAGGQTPMICLPGLTRNAKDFDDLAAVFSQKREIVAVDYRGRGESDYDPQWHQYIPPTYAIDVVAIMDHLDIEHAIFCGTSLGGLVTMLIAQQHSDRVQSVILNDIGPVIEQAGLTRIQRYTGKLPACKDWSDAVAQVRAVKENFQPELTHEHRELFAKRSFREGAEGVPVLDFDPNIGRAIREIDMQLGDPWALFDHLRERPVLVLRGEHSDILSADTVAQMSDRHEQLEHVDIPDRGHVPLLNEPVSVAAIQAFLEQQT